jgi:flagellar assembly factor FliW
MHATNETLRTAEIPVLHFTAGLPAFPDATRFALAHWGGPESPFRKLQCLDDPALAFIVTEPSLFFTDYEPELPDDAVERLGLTHAEDALLLVIVTVGEDPRDATGNLLGPIVIHQRTLEADQVVLGDTTYSPRAPLTVD